MLESLDQIFYALEEFSWKQYKLKTKKQYKLEALRTNLILKLLG